MSLKDQITEDMKTALRARDAQRLSALRLLLAAVKQREVDERIALDDVAVVAVVEKLIKQRRESIRQYELASRMDLVNAELFEVGVLQAYLPAALDEGEIDAELDAALRETGASRPQDMGKVMAWLKPRLAGRADMAAVSAKVKTRLGG